MPKIGDAPSGENTSLAGTEKVPITGSKFTLISTIASYIRTLTQTLTGKTINLTDNTLTGTTAQFNTALSDGDFATLAGSETLTNKTLTAPTIADFTNANHDHGDADDGGTALASPTITTPTISGAITFPDNVTQTFNPGADNAGINVGSIAGDPATPDNGDVWYDSTANELTARIGGANVALGAAGGSAVATDTIWDAKGDIAGGTGANTAARLAVGTNGHVLTADSSQTTGLKWAAASGASGDRSIDNSTDASWTGGDLGYDQEFEATSSSLPGSWAWVNQNSSTYNEGYGRGTIYRASQAGDNCYLIVNSLSGAPSTWLITCKLLSTNLGGNFGDWYMTLREAGTGEFIRFGIRNNATVVLDRWNSPTSYNSGTTSQALPVGVYTMYFRIRKNSSTSFDFEYSIDAKSWIALSSAHDPSGFLTIDQYGIGLLNSTGALAGVSCEWIRLR